ncbi:multidrug resistance-associated protein [Skeletonema marinoi]|uniref:Multidrug resistance-associated protein n=1 Tax=Skeletonema marinoi TaxID=267567 RepID=A0AAD9D4V3_9STRA|nr:multidrug resistance-associated protein [Skeletonema marinoi]
MGLTSGNVTNLVATDTQKLFEVMHDGHQIWSCPLAIVVVVVLLLLVVGPPCLVGAAILIGLVPLSKRVAHWIVRIRKQRVAVADERIEIVSAMLKDIKITKLMNYEDEFERRVQDARRREMALVRKEQFVWGLTLVIRVFTPVLASSATFVTYVLVSQDNIMTASVVFTLTMLFNMLKFPINQAGQLLSKAALGVQAIHRISRFMGRESKEHGISERQQISAEGDDKEDVVLEVKDGSFHLGGGASIPSADRVDSEVTNATASFTLSGINFRLNRGEVLAVVGPVASGKSTLIQGLLGDVQSSDETSIAMASGSNVSYAAQTPFILSTTVRENITFGSPFDRDRYDRVLDACCLRPDLKQWPAGDLTEIGERGVTMSGGQKQRVSVARAVYANVDVVLFDDILSALDAGTSQKLFDNLFDNVHDTTSLLHNCGSSLSLIHDIFFKEWTRYWFLTRESQSFVGAGPIFNYSSQIMPDIRRLSDR